MLFLYSEKKRWRQNQLCTSHTHRKIKMSKRFVAVEIKKKSFIKILKKNERRNWNEWSNEYATGKTRTKHIKGYSICLTNDIWWTTKAVSFSVRPSYLLLLPFSFLIIYLCVPHSYIQSRWRQRKWKHRKNLKYAHKISNKLPGNKMNEDKTKEKKTFSFSFCENKHFHLKVIYFIRAMRAWRWAYKKNEQTAENFSLSSDRRKLETIKKNIHNENVNRESLEQEIIENVVWLRQKKISFIIIKGSYNAALFLIILL